MLFSCKTYFSYRYGTFSTRELVEEASRRGIGTLALTNINGAPDAWEFVDLCRKAGIIPVLGCEVWTGDQFRYVLLARNEEGFAEINSLISGCNLKQKTMPARLDYSENFYVIYPLGALPATELNAHEYIGVKPSEVNRLFRTVVPEQPGKYIIRHPVTFQDKTRYHLHRLLRAIDQNTLVSKLDTGQLAAPDEMMCAEEEIVNVFAAYPGMIAGTEQLLANCGISTELGTDKGKRSFTASPQEDRQLLRTLAVQAMEERYPNGDPALMERIDRELEVIGKLGFTAYYLLVGDVVAYARRRGFFYVGRGSGANSIVAYLLRITDVDPIQLDLYFERFLNEFRSSPPDFDIDFSYRDRDEVIRYVFDRYGQDRVALLGMHSTFKRRAIIRELGKVLGLPKREIDQLVLHPLAAFSEDSLQRKIQKFGQLMLDFPNHHSVHAGGMLVAEEPITRYSALELPSKGFPATQIDLFGAEKIGLFKLDILSQRGLGHIKDTLELVKRNRGEVVDITRVNDFMRDPRVAEELSRANTIGCFYIESPAMRQLLLKLRCRDYLTLVAASSIIRPGVAQSGMMKQYVRHHLDPEAVRYLHPILKELLEETFGVMVYQEDVIRVAHRFGGFTLAEADILRRVLSGKYKGVEEMERLRAVFIANCRERAYPESLVSEVWRQMASFAGYSFSKGHSASFAVESYQSLFLKTYFPMEFMVSVINNFGGFYRTEVYFQELKRTGAQVHAPCVNRSDRYTILDGHDVYVGWVHLDKLSDELVNRLLTERLRQGPFAGLHDFIARVQPPLEQLTVLVRIGAFRFTGHSSKELLWQANFLQKRNRAHPAMATLFAEPEFDFTLPNFTVHPGEEALAQVELLGFPLGDVFQLAGSAISGNGYIDRKEWPMQVGREVTTVGYLVTTKDSWTRKNERMVFGTWMDAGSDWFDTVHWPGTLSRYPFSGSGFYRLQGRVLEDDGTYTLEVIKMEKVAGIGGATLLPGR